MRLGSAPVQRVVELSGKNGSSGSARGYIRVVTVTSFATLRRHQATALRHLWLPFRPVTHRPAKLFFRGGI